jgi:cation:H+ antiporter
LHLDLCLLHGFVTEMIVALIQLPFPGLSVWLLLLIMGVGFTALMFGGDWLTHGAVAIAKNLNINPVVVGLTIVSMATSMPEMMTSLLAAKASPGLALGNILGSNIANIGLILGITAIISPLVIQLRLLQREVPLLLLVTALFAFCAIGGYSRIEGILLLSIVITYLFFVVRWAKKESAAVAAEFDDEAIGLPKASTGVGIFWVLLGGVLLGLGADILVGASVEMAGRMGISETLIGLTIVAIGTSLPELSASISAARSGHSDICAGNIIGSNLFNILLIGGGVATIIPIPVDPSLLLVEIPALVLITVLLLWIFKSGHIVTRGEGVFLLFLYFTILSLSALSQLGYLF